MMALSKVSKPIQAWRGEERESTWPGSLVGADDASSTTVVGCQGRHSQYHSTQ
jgi:hypothetical protein